MAITGKLHGCHFKNSPEIEERGNDFLRFSFLYLLSQRLYAYAAQNSNAWWHHACILKQLRICHLGPIKTWFFEKAYLIIIESQFIRRVITSILYVCAHILWNIPQVFLYKLWSHFLDFAADLEDVEEVDAVSTSCWQSPPSQWRWQPKTSNNFLTQRKRK